MNSRSSSYLEKPEGLTTSSRFLLTNLTSWDSVSYIKCHIPAKGGQRFRFFHDDAATYNCIVTGDCGEIFSNEAILSLSMTVGINDLSQSDVSIYPNPSNGIFVIAVDEIYNLEITDLSGRLILRQKLINSKNTIKLNQSGIYMLRLSNSEGTINRKIIVTD